MRDTKVPIGWLIPIVGLILLLGWFLGRQGWSVSKLNLPGIELVPPTATVASQSIQSSQPVTTSLPPTVGESNLLPNGELVSPDSLARLIGGKPEYWTKRGPVVWGYWDKGHSITFRHPGSNTILTYWAGFPEPRNAEGCSIVIPQADNMTRYVKCPSGTKAEFEADGVGFHLVDYTGFFP